MQLETDKNRFISLFSGYPHIPGLPLRNQIDFDDLYNPRKPEDEDPALREPNTPRPPPEDFAVGRSPLPVGNPDEWNLVTPELHNVASRPFQSPTSAPPRPKPVDPNPASRGGGAAGDERIQVTYGEGGRALDLDVDQVNILIDNDVIGSGVDAAGPRPDHDVHDMDDLINVGEQQNPYGNIDTPADVLSQLEKGPIGTSSPGGQSGYGPGYHEAVTVDATPGSNVDVSVNVNLGWTPPANSIEGATETSHVSTLEPGVTIDGHTYARGAEADAARPVGPQDLIPEVPQDNPAVPTDSSENVAVVLTGDNLQVNAGGLVDTQVVGTLMVMGDSYHSNAIVQTNVLVDESVVAGTKDSATIQTGGNETDNVAEFINSLAENPYEMGFFGGLRWNVDRVSGDLHDIKMVTQLNDMRDNDFVRQVATEHYKYVETGNNLQGNLFDYSVSDQQYDLIIVSGNYYGANWIFQTNVLLNSDYVQITEGEHGSGEQTVSTGANWLMNSARIVDFTGQAQALTPDMQALVNSLQGGAESLDLSSGFAVAGNGSMDLNVLFIDGDYYDINVLQQTNIMEDTDMVLQTLGHGEAGHVATGGNELQNDGVLINLGPLGGEYVNGNQYSESVLIQTNIVAQSSDVPPTQGVVTNDPTKLASEAGIFIAQAPAPDPEPEQSSAPPPSDTGSISSDPLGGVLT